MKAQELIAFLEKFAAAKAKPPASSADGNQAKQKKQKELSKVYKELTLSEFEGLQDKEDAWLVVFSAGGSLGLLSHLRHKHGLPSGVACWSGSMSAARSASAVSSHACLRGPHRRPHHSIHAAGCS